jgi:two-component system chemotaxis response regulator CheB
MIFPGWTDSQQGDAIEIPLDADELLLVLISDGVGKGSAAAKFASAELKQLESNKEELKKWFTGKLTQLGANTSFRLLGSETVIAQLTGLFRGFGATEGKPVSIKNSNLVQFIPKEGRVRLAKEGTFDKAVSAPTQQKTRGKTKVLVVDDSESICRLLSRIFNDDPDIECVATVEHPKLVDEAILKYKPDLITLDIHMPEVDGVTLLKRLLPQYYIPIIMISALSPEDGTSVLDALEAGAIDYIQKPTVAEIKVVAPIICEKIKSAAASKALRKTGSILKRPASVKAHASGEMDPSYLIAIGASTGGTEALRDVLVALPKEIPPILIVQHIPAFFSKALADRLNQLVSFEVKEAENGEKVTNNKVLIAPGGKQMKIVERGGEFQIDINDSAPVNRHKPSVDYLFDSVVNLRRKKVVAAILTGMGDDGAQGILKLRKSGALTIGQDEATCVVYGMPREAAKLGALEKVAPLDQIAMNLIRGCGGRI